MPLIKKSSKKAFSRNVEAEMQAGKPQDQSLAIAYDVQRQSRKKKRMANGGMVNQSRPMPEDRNNDAVMVRRNSAKKSLPNDKWDDNPTIEQAQRPSPSREVRPKQLGSDSFDRRYQAELEEDSHRIDSEYPESDRAEPKKSYDEINAKSSGNPVSDMNKQHNNRRAPYERAIEDQYSEDMAAPGMKKVQSPLGRYARGGMIDMEPEDHGQEMEERRDEADMQRDLSSNIHGEQPELWRDELFADDENSNPLDMERQHNNGRSAYADGGRVQLDPLADADDADDSISGAVMRRRKMMAKGGIIEDGMVDIQENGCEMPAHLSPYDHDNEEAILKELYDDSQISDQPRNSNEHGDDIDSDKHDMVEQIRRKIMYKRR